MGRSDDIIFPHYLDLLKLKGRLLHHDGVVRRAAFLGFNGENALTRAIPSPEARDLYDLSFPVGTPSHWDINAPWRLARDDYDLIVCTRCPYFSKCPEEFVSTCLDHLVPGGRLLADWGLGDHWRFPEFRVGWYDGEWHGEGHEFSTVGDRKEFLHSTLWDPGLEDDAEVGLFRTAICNQRYCDDPRLAHADGLTRIVEDEVPCILPRRKFRRQLLDVRCKMLWAEAPQLYTMVLFQK